MRDDIDGPQTYPKIRLWSDLFLPFGRWARPVLKPDRSVVALQRSVVVAGLLLPLVLSAQARTSIVTGVVTDPASAKPLPGAIVRVEGLRDSAITDAAGRYTLRGLSRDTATIRLQAAGFSPLVLPTLVMGTDTLHFDAQLHNDPVAVVHPKSRHPAPLIIVRVSGDSLRAVIGTDSTWFTRMNIVESMVENVEVLVATRGGAAARYGGTAAVGGVILITTKQASAFPFASHDRRP